MTGELPELTPSSVTELGFGLQVVPAGAPLQVKPMDWLKPAMGVSVVVIELLLPRAIVIELWEFEMVTSGFSSADGYSVCRGRIELMYNLLLSDSACKWPGPPPEPFSGGI